MEISLRNYNIYLSIEMYVSEKVKLNKVRNGEKVIKDISYSGNF